MLYTLKEAASIACMHKIFLNLCGMYVFSWQWDISYTCPSFVFTASWSLQYRGMHSNICSMRMILFMPHYLLWLLCAKTNTGSHHSCALCYLALMNTVLAMQLSITIYVYLSRCCLSVCNAFTVHSHLVYTCIYSLFIFTLDVQNGVTPLMAAAQNNHLEAMEVLLTEYNGNINAKDRVRHSFSCLVITLSTEYCV